jgi:protein SCO1/2
MRRAALGLAVLALAGCGGGSNTSPPTVHTPTTPKFRGATVQPVKAIDFALRDQNGKLIKLSSLRGRYVILAFLYTRCPDICPVIASNLNSAIRQLGPRAKVTVLAVSVDPKRDTPAAVRAYIRERHLVSQFHYLIGTRKQLLPVWKAYGVPVMPGDLKTISHGAFEPLIDPHGVIKLIYDSRVKTSDVVHDLRVLGA